MAANVTLLQMRTDARYRADMDTGAAAAFASDTIVTRLVNQAVKRLYNKLIAARGGDYYAVRTTISVVPDTASYSLPADFMSLIALQMPHNGEFYDIGKYELREEVYLKGTHVSNDPRAIRFRLQSQSVLFQPTPKVAAEVVIIYVPTFTELSLDGDTFDGINGWEDWITYTVAIELRRKAKHSVAELSAERAELDAEIAKLADHRDGQPAKIIDTRRDHAYWWPYYTARYD